MDHFVVVILKAFPSVLVKGLYMKDAVLFFTLLESPKVSNVSCSVKNKKFEDKRGKM